MHKFDKFYNKIFKIGLFFVIFLFLLTACSGRENTAAEFSISEDDWNDNGAQTNDNEALVQTEAAEIYVHICGAVVNPGVYALEEGSRVFEGIKAAGGFSEDACEDYVNLASELKDGERLVIPTTEEVEAAREAGTYQDLWINDTSAGSVSGTESTADGAGLININTATESELSSISGIGQGKAAAIIQYRQENGNFESIEEIMNVSGIKEGTYEKIKDKITVS